MAEVTQVRYIVRSILSGRVRRSLPSLNVTVREFLHAEDAEDFARQKVAEGKTVHILKTYKILGYQEQPVVEFPILPEPVKEVSTEQVVEDDDDEWEDDED